ncbi:hypothetical protein, partial [Bacillus sp. WP8]|uniref:hypothetical protein n=1 Tax=Bacillus sp. WP8 TaxID=756828 RepID=UPI001C92CD3D
TLIQDLTVAGNLVVLHDQKTLFPFSTIPHYPHQHDINYSKTFKKNSNKSHSISSLHLKTPPSLSPPPFYLHPIFHNTFTTKFKHVFPKTYPM